MDIDVLSLITMLFFFFFKLILSQEDITTILRTLNENIGESSGASPPSQELKDTTSHCSDIRSTSEHSAGNIFYNQVLLSVFTNFFQLILSIGFTFIKKC